jgi:hypothetical protein
MGFLEDSTLADTTYRMLSAITHAQVHGLIPYIARDLAVRHERGYSTVPGAMTGQQAVLWSLTITGCLDAVMQRYFDLYGWSPIRWNSVSRPLLTEWVGAVRS